MTVASRGLVAFEVTVTGASKDLHSGRHGGSAPNPISALSKADRVAARARMDALLSKDISTAPSPPDARIIAAIEAANFDADAYYREIGSPKPDPIATGRELLIRQWLEPTLEFNGISGGYQGKGTKTVIPTEASVKITCRPIAGQKPDHIVDVVTRHLKARLPAGFALDIHRHGPGSEAFFIDPDLPR